MGAMQGHSPTQIYDRIADGFGDALDVRSYEFLRGAAKFEINSNH